MRALLVIPLMLILGGWATPETRSRERLDPDAQPGYVLQRMIDDNLRDQERLYQFWLEQQRQDREMRCQRRSIRYRCPELME